MRSAAHLTSGHGEQLGVAEVMVLIRQHEQQLVVVEDLQQGLVFVGGAADAPVGGAVGEVRGQHAVVLVVRVDEDERRVDLVFLQLSPLVQQVVALHVGLHASPRADTDGDGGGVELRHPPRPCGVLRSTRWLLS